MKEEFPKNIVNPETSSIREESLNLVPVEKNIFKDKVTGEIFHKLKAHGRGELQKFVSLSLKGIINTTDIVESNGEYFSHEQNISNLEPDGAFSPEQIAADGAVLRAVFGDWDHTEHVEQEKNSEDSWDRRSYLNISIDQNTNKRYFFDFGDAAIGRYASNGDDFRKTIQGFLKNENPQEIPFINKKAKLALDLTFNESNYKSFQSMLGRSGLLAAYANPQWDNGSDSFRYKFDATSTTEDLKAKELFNTLRNRFEILYQETQSDPHASA